jgi:site-specific DNA recombinase
MAAIRESAVTEPSTLAVYMRVSTEEQRERQTVASQRNAADRYLALQSITPYSWYGDEGVSGTIPLGQRPDGARLLADIRAGHIKTVLIHKLDRLGRSVRVLIDARDELMALGVELVSINEHLDTTNAAGRMFFNQLSTFAEFERDTIFERSTGGTARLLREGRWAGGQVPYGYMVEGKQQTARLVIDEEPARVVRIIYQRVVELGETCRQVATWLNDQAIPAPAGGLWGHGRVYDLLTNSVYRGLATFGKRKKGQPRTNKGLITVPVPAIVSTEVWNAAQARLQSHKHWQQRTGERTYLLAGLMRCGVCGHRYSGEWIGNHPGTPGYRQYCCNQRRRPHVLGSKCRSASVNADWVERQVLADVEAWVSDPDVALSMLATRMRGNMDQAETLRAQMAQAQSQLDAQQAERDSILALFRKGRITERDLDRQLDAIDAEQATIQARLRQLQDQISEANDAAAHLTRAADVLARFHERRAAGQLTDREMMEGLVMGIVVDTQDAGLSTRGRPKIRPAVTVTYCFEQPANSVGNVSCMPGRAAPHG